MLPNKKKLAALVLISLLLQPSIAYAGLFEEFGNIINNALKPVADHLSKNWGGRLLGTAIGVASIVGGVFVTPFCPALGQALIGGGIGLISYSLLSENPNWQGGLMAYGTGFVIGLAMGAIAQVAGHYGPELMRQGLGKMGLSAGKALLLKRPFMIALAATGIFSFLAAAVASAAPGGPLAPKEPQAQLQQLPEITPQELREITKEMEKVYCTQKIYAEIAGGTVLVSLCKLDAASAAEFIQAQGMSGASGATKGAVALAINITSQDCKIDVDNMVATTDRASYGLLKPIPEEYSEKSSFLRAGYAYIITIRQPEDNEQTVGDKRIGFVVEARALDKEVPDTTLNMPPCWTTFQTMYAKPPKAVDGTCPAGLYVTDGYCCPGENMVYKEEWPMCCPANTQYSEAANYPGQGACCPAGTHFSPYIENGAIAGYLCCPEGTYTVVTDLGGQWGKQARCCKRVTKTLHLVLVKDQKGTVKTTRVDGAEVPWIACAPEDVESIIVDEKGQIVEPTDYDYAAYNVVS